MSSTFSFAFAAKAFREKKSCAMIFGLDFFPIIDIMIFLPLFYQYISFLKIRCLNPF